MADSPEFSAGRRTKNGVIWHDSPSWTGPSSSQKIHSQRVPVKPVAVHNQKRSGENENYFEPPSEVDDEIFEDEELHDSFESMLSTKSQRSTLDQKSQKLVWKKDEDDKELLDDLKQGVEAGKRSLEKLKVLKKKKKSDGSESSMEVDVKSPKKTPMSVKNKRLLVANFPTPTYPIAHSTPKISGIRVQKKVEPGTSQKIKVHDSFDDSVDDLDYQPSVKLINSPSTPRPKNNSINPQKSRIEGREVSNVVFQTPSVAGNSNLKTSMNDFSSRTISRGLIMDAVSTPKSGRKRPASNSGTPIFKKAKSTETMEDPKIQNSASKQSLMKSKSFQITMNYPLTTEFPFHFLHSEVVKYYIEKHAEYKQKRQEFLEKTRHNEDSSVIDKDKNLLAQLAMSNNAETRLEALGFKVGYAMVEKVAKDLPRFTSELDMMKFICKEFWTSAFGKQVDNLRTNHQNIYVVQDNKFMTLMSLAEGTQYLKECSIYLCFPAGIVRGALANLGIKCVVAPAVETLPVVKFSIHLHKSS